MGAMVRAVSPAAAAAGSSRARPLAALGEHRGTTRASGTVSAPGDRDGDTPSGVRPIDAAPGAPGGGAAFAAVRPRSGRQVRAVPGADRLGADQGRTLAARAAGHPGGAGRLITGGTSRTRAGTSHGGCSGYFGEPVRALRAQAPDGS
ncbi:hypothetical protein [Kitasatospora phosalacinea]|uniref:hypothetical protein n=1 Tax=Kitasatospora phosalacinea TaxID=2065 RepID=UPI000ABD53D5|nr:hypothetical protein [Kitasatospora phosalacinea]